MGTWLLPTAIMAQNSFAQNVYVSITTEALMKSKDYEGIGANSQLGYKIIPSLYAFADFDGGYETETERIANAEKCFGVKICCSQKTTIAQ